MPQDPSTSDPSALGPSVVVVVVAHGSRAETANEAHLVLVDALAQAVDVPVTPGFLELATPSIPDAIDRAVAAGASTVLVLPYFLHPGRHLSDDLPRIISEANTRHPDRVIRLLESFGADPALTQILAEQVRSAL